MGRKNAEVSSRNGLLVVICLHLASDKFNVELDNSNKFSSSLDVLQKPALAGGVKNGLKVLTENGSGTLVNMPLHMLVAMPGWITISSPRNQWRKRRMTEAPFLQATIWRSFSEGSVGTVSPSVVEANKIPFLECSSNFFHAFIFVSSWTSSGADAKRMDWGPLLILSAS